MYFSPSVQFNWSGRVLCSSSLRTQIGKVFLDFKEPLLYMYVGPRWLNINRTANLKYSAKDIFHYMPSSLSASVDNVNVLMHVVTGT